jgi:hypothetical protein
MKKCTDDLTIIGRDEQRSPLTISRLKNCRGKWGVLAKRKKGDKPKLVTL